MRYRTALLLASALLATGCRKHSHDYPKSPAMLLSERCRAKEDLRVAANAEATRRGQIAVVASLRQSRPDPAADARRAGAAGAWGLIRSYTMMGSSPYGVDCATDAAMGNGQPLVRAYRVFSDVGCGETFGADRDCTLENRMDGYAAVYDATLTSLADYPYRDLCRPTAALPQTGPREEQRDIADWGFRPAVEPAAPRNAAEAARRGNLAALAAFAARDPQALAAADDYGMTPLAWAVAYRQPEAARWLASHRAPILEDDCVKAGAAVSPLRIALRTGQDELATALSARLPHGGRGEDGWGGDLVMAAAEGGATGSLKRMLSERHGGRLLGQPPGHEWHPAARPIIDAYKRGPVLDPPGSGPTRVEVISAYEGPSLSGSGWPPRQGPIDVTVGRTRTPVILVLAAHDATEWRLTVEPGARLAGVLTLGIEWQEVSGLPHAIPLVHNLAGEQCSRLDARKPVFYVSKEDDEDIAQFRKGVRQILGRPIDRLRAAYNAQPAYRVD